MAAYCQDPVVLVVDDDPDILELTVEGLILHGFAARGAGSPEEAVGEMHAHHFAAIVADLHLPRASDGENLCARAVSIAPDTLFFLLSGDRAIAEIARRHGVAGILKPVRPSEIARHLRASLPRPAEDCLER